ncbi:MAG: NADH-quinone oxidoreductase subunit J [Halosimplex sp.]
MTSRPRLATDVNYVNGLAALALFAVMAYVFLTSQLSNPAGFADGSITASIGYAMFDMLDQGAVGAESFLVAFEIIDVVLVAALVGAVTLARREGDESVVQAVADGGFLTSAKETSSELRSDGGRRVAGRSGETRERSTPAESADGGEN